MYFIYINIINAKEFCLYGYDGINKVVDPYYINSNNETIYFETIEEYAKYSGPTWFGVSICGNNMLVNNVGVYYEYVNTNTLNKESKTGKIETEKLNNKIDKNIEIINGNDKLNNFHKKNGIINKREKISNKDSIDVNNLNSKEEIREYYENLYKKLNITNLQCIPLTSINPAYNPYHKSLMVGIKNADKVNIITNIGSPIGGSGKDLNGSDNIKVGENIDINECGLVYNMKGATISCGIRISKSVEDSISISDTNGNTYHKAYGIVTSNTNSYTDDINTILELSLSSTDSNSLSESESNSVSNAAERTISYSISNSESVTDDTSNTHSTSHDESYAHTISEEQTHSRTDGGETVNETNWSKSEEVSHTDEYSRMDLNDYNKAKNSHKKRNLTHLNKRFLGIGTDEVEAGCEVANTAINAAGLEEQIRANEIAKDANKIAEDANKKAEDANNIARDANDIAGTSNDIARNANDISSRSIDSQEKIAAEDSALQRELNKLQLDQELNIALAGTRSTSDTHTTGRTWGGIKSESKNWSDTYTTTSGVSDTWTTSNGYSDAFTVGHSETSTEETSQSDSISNSLTNSYTKDRNWSNEKSKTTSSSNSYSFGKSNSISHTNDISMDEAIDRSVEHTYTKSQTNSTTIEFTKNLEWPIAENGCFNLTVDPRFLSEVNIWACGNYNEETDKSYVTFQKSIHTIKYLGNIQSIIECNNPNNDLHMDSINIEDNNFIRKVITIKEGINKNSLLSGEVLNKGECISSPNGKWHFGLLNNGELALCQGEFKESNIRWSNKIDYIDKYNPKFFIANNGHLVITAKNIFAQYQALNDDIYNSNSNKNLSKRGRFDDIDKKYNNLTTSTTTKTSTITNTSTITKISSTPKTSSTTSSYVNVSTNSNTSTKLLIPTNEPQDNQNGFLLQIR